MGEISSPEKTFRKNLMTQKSSKIHKTLIKILSLFLTDPAPVLEDVCLFSDSERTMDVQDSEPESTCLVATTTVSIFSVSSMCVTVSVLKY